MLDVAAVEVAYSDEHEEPNVSTAHRITEAYRPLVSAAKDVIACSCRNRDGMSMSVTVDLFNALVFAINKVSG